MASLKYNDNYERIVTLFVYDSYGNLTQVVNPEKQNTHYEYNISGQLVKETTVDAGIKRYMYNKQGLVSVTLDEQGQFYDPNGNGLPGNPLNGTTDAFYRIYQYDDYGRLMKTGRCTVPYNYSLDQEIPFLQYKTTEIGDIVNGIPENGDMSENGRYLNYVYSNASSQDWLASFDAWHLAVGGGGTPTPQIVTISGFENLYINTLEKETFYGGDVASNEIGKVVKTHSYDNSGMKILKTELTYDDFDNLATQITMFNPDMDVDQAPVQDNITSVINYPAYNYRNSLKEQTVDVDNDGTIDYHCFMEYDALNRLKAIHGAAGLVANISNATLLVSYEYNDANGLVDKKKHYVDDANGLSVLANEIDYTYDVRDRLTEIKAGLNGDNMMHYELFYDDDIVPSYQNGSIQENVSYTHNWNGNINGTRMNYHLDITNASIANPIDHFDKALVYGYSYDRINRLVSADAIVGNFVQTGSDFAERLSIGDVSLRYDRIGNIESLHRTVQGPDVLLTNPVQSVSNIQHWNYNYSGATNRLINVVGVGATVTRNYTYDANGNLLTDDSKDLDATEYGRAAYPFEIAQDQTTLNYLYSENDLRIYKKSLLYYELGNEWSEDYYLMDGMGKTVAILHKSQNDITGKWEYFASGSERECRLSDEDDNGTFNTSMNTNGDIEASFYLYDHLGNTRVNYSPKAIISHPNDPATIEQTINSVVDYFPYGKVLRHYNVTDERYLTTQHERDQATGLDYRGARYYDGDVGRFLSLDPLAAKFPNWSDYNYTLSNPIKFVDPDGKAPTNSDPPKNVHYYNMAKDNEGNYKPVYSHSNTNLRVKTNAKAVNTSTNATGTLFTGSYGSQESTTNVYTYWNGDGTIKRQTVKSKTLESFGPSEYIRASNIINGTGESAETSSQGVSASSIVGIGIGVADEVTNSKLTGKWLGKNLTYYDISYGGNGTSGGRIKWNGKLGKVAKFGGFATAGWSYYSIYDDYSSGAINSKEAAVETTSTTIGLIPLYGTAWTIGFEAGKVWGPSTWYGDNDYKYFE